MSSFLALNGIDVPCGVAGGSKATIEEIATSKRAFDGTMLVHRRATKGHWGLTLAITDDQHARAFRDLVLGKGHYWSFDATVYSSKGLGPTLAPGSVQSATGGYIGAGKLSQTAGGGNNIQFTVSEIVTRNQWTVMYARKVGAGSYVHYIATFDGSTTTYYTAGAAGSAQTWLGVVASTGVVTLTSDAASTTLIDELVILPFCVPSDWPAQMYALNNAGTAWSPLARLNATGTGIEGNTRTVQVKGTAKEITAMPSTIPGSSFAENNGTFAFEIEEI